MNMNYPLGLCTQMCSEEEINRREQEGLLHILEIHPNSIKTRNPKANRNFVVKEFSRSAAGRAAQDVRNLRTIDALLHTVNYLLHDVITIEYVPWNVIYDFIVDRLRAVRQDMVIQNMSRSNWISLLQPMIKFYVYAGYRLCEEHISIFDPVLNTTHLQECLKRLLNLYAEIDILEMKISKISGDNSILRTNSLYCDSRPVLEALYLILNLGNTTAMQRALQIPSSWRTELVKTCLNISLEYWKNNFIRVCREIRKLPPLLFMCAVLHLPRIRKKTFEIMSVSYNSTFPCDVIQKLFLYNNLKEILEDCTYYNIPIINGNIVFSKKHFDTAKSELRPKKIIQIEESLSNYQIPDLLLDENLL